MGVACLVHVDQPAQTIAVGKSKEAHHLIHFIAFDDLCIAFWRLSEEIVARFHFVQGLSVRTQLGKDWSD